MMFAALYKVLALLHLDTPLLMVNFMSITSINEFIYRVKHSNLVTVLLLLMKTSGANSLQAASSQCVHMCVTLYIYLQLHLDQFLDSNHLSPLTVASFQPRNFSNSADESSKDAAIDPFSYWRPLLVQVLHSLVWWPCCTMGGIYLFHSSRFNQGIYKSQLCSFFYFPYLDPLYV